MKTIVISLEQLNAVRNRKINETKTVEKIDPTQKRRPLLRRPDCYDVETKYYASTSKLSNDFYETKIVQKTEPTKPTKKIRPTIRRPNYNAVETKNYASTVVKNLMSKLSNDFDETILKNYNVYFTNYHKTDFEIVMIDKLNKTDFRKTIIVNEPTMIDKTYQSIKNYILSHCENDFTFEQKLAA